MRKMTGRSLVKDMVEDIQIVRLFVDIEFHEDETDIVEVGKDWTFLAELSRDYDADHFSLTAIKCCFHNDTFMPLEAWQHIAENYEMITYLTEKMIETGNHSNLSIPYEDEDYEDEDTDNCWCGRAKQGVNFFNISI